MENDQRKNDLNRPGGRDNFKKEILKRELSKKKNLLNKDQQKILTGVLMTVAVAVVGVAGYMVGRMGNENNSKVAAAEVVVPDEEKIAVAVDGTDEDEEAKEAARKSAAVEKALAAKKAAEEKAAAEVEAEKKAEEEAEEEEYVGNTKFIEVSEEDEEKYKSQTTTNIVHEDSGSAQYETETAIDPSQMENPIEELVEAELPEGVVSTLTGKDAKMQIVLLGDSQIGNFKGTDGIAYLLKKYCQANVYNLAMGGTSGTVPPDEPTELDKWESRSLPGMVNAICGRVDPHFFEQYEYTYDVFKSCDFSKTDIFVIEYGVNDFFQKSTLRDADMNEDPAVMVKNFGGAMEYSIRLIREYFPKAQIIFCCPTYAQFFDGATHAYLGDGNIMSNGIGTLENYSEIVQNIVGEHSNTQTIDFYHNLINGYSAKECLLDGVHMNEEGRRRYTQLLARYIIRDMGYQIEPDTDPSTVDWVSTKKK